MKTTTLNFYENFQCRASACKHNCCLKWQIDVDKKTLKRYKKVKGDFSKTLCMGIDFENERFKLCNDRCAFLNDDNLCEIYINLGKKSLCQVCADHPRYRNFFTNKIEVGVGLACEVIAEKIANFNDMAKEVTLKKGFSIKKLTKLEREIIEFREKTFAILQDRSLSLTDRFEEILSLLNVDISKLFEVNFREVFLSLEILDERWKDRLLKIQDRLSIDSFLNDFQIAFEQLAVYFTHRHLSNAIDFLDIKSRVIFSIISVITIAFISKEENGKNIDVVISVARQYSEEIEYSDENVSNLLDIFDRILIE